MISRRTALGCVASILSAACVDTKDYKPYRPQMSLAQALETLRTIKTESALTAAFGRPDFSIDFLGSSDVTKTRASWRQYYSRSMPADLIETMAAGTKLDAYGILLFDSINPWRTYLYVAVGADGELLGWMHPGAGYEQQMRFDHMLS